MDYSKSTVEVFANVAAFLILGVGLNVLKAVQGRSGLIGLPTWAPGWPICETRELDIVFPDANIWNLTEAELHFPEPRNSQKAGLWLCAGSELVLLLTWNICVTSAPGIGTLRSS